MWDGSVYVCMCCMSEYVITITGQYSLYRQTVISFRDKVLLYKIIILLDFKLQQLHAYLCLIHNIYSFLHDLNGHKSSF